MREMLSGLAMQANAWTKGDVSRYLLWTIVLLIMLVIALVLLYEGAFGMVQNMFLNQLK
jgi:hypothetical protein